MMSSKNVYVRYLDLLMSSCTKGGEYMEEFA